MEVDSTAADWKFFCKCQTGSEYFSHTADCTVVHILHMLSYNVMGMLAQTSNVICSQCLPWRGQCIFQQDDVKLHIVSNVKPQLHRRRVRKMNWPACSPNLWTVDIWHTIAQKYKLLMLLIYLSILYTHK